LSRRFELVIDRKIYKQKAMKKEQERNIKRDEVQKKN
jgi:hypothetical protein